MHNCTVAPISHIGSPNHHSTLAPELMTAEQKSVSRLLDDLQASSLLDEAGAHVVDDAGESSRSTTRRSGDSDSAEPRSGQIDPVTQAVRAAVRGVLSELLDELSTIGDNHPL